VRDDALSPKHFEALEQGAAEQFDEVQKTVASERTKFFEQIALLSGGAIVLSVSLLSTLFGKAILFGTPMLIVGWCALLLTLLTSLFRTLAYLPYMLEVSMAHYQKTLAEKKLALVRAKEGGNCVVAPMEEDGKIRQVSVGELRQQASELFGESKRRKEAAEKMIGRVFALEKLALSCFCLGVFLLTVFAGYNLVKAPLAANSVSISTSPTHSAKVR
jgi:hypothetical protein